MSSESEQLELHRRYLNSTDPEERNLLREQLVRIYERLVYFIARKFLNRGESLEDIAQVGFLGLVKALDRFDPELGNQFTTFATPTITGEIKRYFRDKSWSIRFPRRLQELYRQAVRVNEEMRQSLDRQPTVPELASRLGVEPGDVLEAMEIGSAQTPSSLDAKLGGDDEHAIHVGDTIGDLDPGLQQVETEDLLDRAMANLTDRERKIMVMRFVDELSQSEVAERLGISQMHVSRLQRAAQEQLRNLLAVEPVSS